MGILSWIIIGLLAGIVAKALMPGRDPGGFIITTLLGIAGALVGGWIGTAIFGRGFEGWDWGSFGLAVLGAIVLLGIYRVIRGRRGADVTDINRRRAA